MTDPIAKELNSLIDAVGEYGDAPMVGQLIEASLTLQANDYHRTEQLLTEALIAAKEAGPPWMVSGLESLLHQLASRQVH